MKWVGLAIEIASYAGFPYYLQTNNRLDKLYLFILCCINKDTQTIFDNFSEEQFSLVLNTLIPWIAPVGFLIAFLPEQKKFIENYYKNILMVATYVSFAYTILNHYHYL